MDESSKPLAAFFHVVLDELKKRLAPAEFSELLSECEVETEGTGADTISTPKQKPAPSD